MNHLQCVNACSQFHYLYEHLSHSHEEITIDEILVKLGMTPEWLLVYNNYIDNMIRQDIESE